MLIDYNSTNNTFFVKGEDILFTKTSFNTRYIDKQGNYTWIYPASFPDGLVAIRDIKKVFPNIKATELAIERINYLKSVPKSIQNLELVKSTDIKLDYTLFNHQLEGVEYALHYPRLAIIYQQGLGKTLVAITALLYKRKIQGVKFGKTIIIMPKILIRNWEEEFKKFGQDLRVCSLARTTTTKKLYGELDEIINKFVNNELDILLTNFEMFVPRNSKDDIEQSRYIIDKISSIGFNRIIIDEASRLKGAKSKRGVEISDLALKASEVYLLSGTISLGNPLDVYKPYSILHPNLLDSSYYHFKNRYCVFSPYNKHIILKYKNLHILKGKINDYTIFKKRDECLDLPDRQIITKYYDLSNEQIKWINAIITMDEIPIDHLVPNMPPLQVTETVVKIIKLRQILSGFINVSNSINNEKVYYKLKTNPKLELLENMLTNIDEKCIIWCSLRNELEDVTSMLQSLNIPYIKSDEEDSYLKFEQSDNIKVYIGQVSTGIGTTMNSAKITIYYSNSLKLEDREQSMDRNYRIGQKDNVIVYDLIAKNSLDEAILQLLNKKVSVLNFIQSNQKCIFCAKMDYCNERNIRIFSRGCLYYDLNLQSQKVEKIKLKTFKEK